MKNKLFLTLAIFSLALLVSQTSYAAYGKKKATPPPEPAAAPAAPAAPAAAEPAAPAQPAAPAAENALPPGMTPEMMAKMKDFMTPNENHKILDYFAGNWDYSMKWWMKAEMTPEESTGTSEGKWIMDGRFMQQSVHGMSMGQPFEGMEIIGYDNAKKHYSNIWLDNMGTGIMVSSSTYDPASKIFAEAGTTTCPFETSGEKNFRAVLTITDNDHYTYQWFTTPLGEPTASEFKSMEITYTRKK